MRHDAPRTVTLTGAVRRPRRGGAEGSDGSSARADAAAIIAGRRDREGKADRPNAARVRASPERTRANVRTSARGKTRAGTID